MRPTAGLERRYLLPPLQALPPFHRPCTVLLGLPPGNAPRCRMVSAESEAHVRSSDSSGISSEGHSYSLILFVANSRAIRPIISSGGTCYHATSYA